MDATITIRVSGDDAQCEEDFDQAHVDDLGAPHIAHARFLAARALLSLSFTKGCDCSRCLPYRSASGDALRALAEALRSG